MVTDKRESDAIVKIEGVSPSKRLERNRPTSINIATVRAYEESKNTLLLPGKKAPQPT